MYDDYQLAIEAPPMRERAMEFDEGNARAMDVVGMAQE